VTNVKIDGINFVKPSLYFNPIAQQTSKIPAINKTIHDHVVDIKNPFNKAVLHFALSNAAGAICHLTPNLSISHPHCTGRPPPAINFFQYISISR